MYVLILPNKYHLSINQSIYKIACAKNILWWQKPQPRKGTWSWRVLVEGIFLSERFTCGLCFYTIEQNRNKWAVAWDFQQGGILTCVDSDEPLQPPVKLRNSKWCSVSSLTIIEYSIDYQSLWSDCAYAEAGLRLCWSHIPHCWKSHALAQIEHSIHIMKTYQE